MKRKPAHWSLPLPVRTGLLRHIRVRRILLVTWKLNCLRCQIPALYYGLRCFPEIVRGLRCCLDGTFWSNSLTLVLYDRSPHRLQAEHPPGSLPS